MSDHYLDYKEMMQGMLYRMFMESSNCVWFHKHNIRKVVGHVITIHLNLVTYSICDFL